MTAAVFGARLLLAAVFSLAAFAKLRERNAARKAATDFGVPDVLARPVSVALPFIELATAILIVTPPLAIAGVLTAALLLTIFTLAVTANLVRGRRPDCHCFGQVA